MIPTHSNQFDSGDVSKKPSANARASALHQDLANGL